MLESKLINVSKTKRPPDSFMVGLVSATCDYRVDVLLPNILQSRRRDIECYEECIAVKIGRHPGRADADMPVELRSD